MAERDPRYFKVYQDGDDRELEQKIIQIVESGAAPGIDMQAREEIEEIQRKIDSGEIGGGGGGSGVDPKAREDIQKVSTQLTETEKKLPQNQKYLQITNEVNSSETIIDLKNFGRTSNRSSIVVHNYTDGQIAQFDNVGSGTILKLVNAHNPTHRSDKPADYVGEGVFLNLSRYKDGANKSVFSINANGDFVWNGIDDRPAVFTNTKSDNSSFAFEIRATNMNTNLLRLGNASQYVFLFKNDQLVDGKYKRAVIESFAGQTEGMLFDAKAGVLRFKSGGGNTYMEDMLLLSKGLKIGSIAESSAPVNGLFVDSATNTLKFRDASNVVKTVQLV